MESARWYHGGNAMGMGVDANYISSDDEDDGLEWRVDKHGPLHGQQAVGLQSPSAASARAVHQPFGSARTDPHARSARRMEVHTDSDEDI